MVAKTVKAWLILLCIFLSSFSTVGAHSGGLNAYGCHNCYTSYCYGDYHCHGGGSYVVPAAPRYIFPAPKNPESGKWEYEISGDNWCNYDLKVSWDKPVSGDRFSIAASKYAGADPGPAVDTTSLNQTFKNLSAGKWYVNIKTGNAERWSATSYWTIDLPKPTPALDARIETFNGAPHLIYSISCMERVEGPTEFINYLKANNNEPKGSVLLPYQYPTTITVKGWDKSGKEYTKEMSFSPVVSEPPAAPAKTESSNVLGVFTLIFEMFVMIGSMLI